MTLAVIIPALNAGARLPMTLASLSDADAVFVVDGGSADDTTALAAAGGARVLSAPRGRGTQLHAGAQAAIAAGYDWLLFLHADTQLEAGWRAETAAFIAAPEAARRAGAFRFRLDDASPQARRLEAVVAWRCRRLALPYGDQGLLLHKDFYDELGGFRPLPLMEDVDIIRRIGRKRLTLFSTGARTSAERWRKDGWRRRSARNLICLTLYFMGVPPRLLVKLYG